MELPLLDLSIIRSIKEVGMLRNKPDLFQTLFETFYQNSQQLIVNMRQALDGKDIETLEACAHRLKGSAGSLGAARLAAICSNLEGIFRDDLPDFSLASKTLDSLENTFNETMTVSRKDEIL